MTCEAIPAVARQPNPRSSDLRRGYNPSLSSTAATERIARAELRPV